MFKTNKVTKKVLKKESLLKNHSKSIFTQQQQNSDHGFSLRLFGDGGGAAAGITYSRS